MKRNKRIVVAFVRGDANLAAFQILQEDSIEEVAMERRPPDGGPGRKGPKMALGNPPTLIVNIPHRFLRCSSGQLGVT